MGNTGGIRAGEAFVEIWADNSKLTQALKLAKADLEKFGNEIASIGKKMMGIGTAILTPGVVAAKSFATLADDLEKLSVKTGLPIETLSALKYAAEVTDISMEQLAKGIKAMQKNIYGTGQGFSELGISLKQVKSMKPEQQFATLADRIARVSDPTQRAALAMKVFGKAGSDLLPMFQGGSNGINKLMAEAHRLGIVMSSDDVKAAAEFDNTLKRLWASIRNVSNRMGQALIPAFQKVIDSISPIIAKASEWIQANHGTINTIMALGAALVAGGVALFAFGKVFTIVSGMIKAAMTIWAAAKAAIALVGATMTGLLTPLGIAITAVTALTAAWLTFTASGQATVGWFRKGIQGIAADMKSTISALGAALAKGDIALAARILWLTIKMEFAKGQATVMEIWYSFRNTFLEIWQGTGYAMVQVWNTITWAIQQGWAATIDGLQNMWETFTNWYETSVNYIGKILGKVMAAVLAAIDPRISYEEAAKGVDDYFANASKQESERHSKAMNNIQSEYDARRAAANQAYTDKLNNIGAAYAKDLSENEKDSAAKLADVMKQLAEARKQWQAALVDAQKNPEAGGSPTMPRLTLPALAPALESKLQSLSVGTMNPYATSMIGSSGIISVLADKMGKVADNTARMAATLDNIDSEVSE